MDLLYILILLSMVKVYLAISVVAIYADGIKNMLVWDRP